MADRNRTQKHAPGRRVQTLRVALAAPLYGGRGRRAVARQDAQAWQSASARGDRRATGRAHAGCRRLKPRTGPAGRWPMSWVWRSAQRGRGVLCQTHPPPAQAGRLSFARRPAGGDQPISGRAQPQPKTLHLDRRPPTASSLPPAAGTKCSIRSTRPPSRKRFTLAHELGHVLIPWHIGTILDEIDFSDTRKDLSYWELENEANRFAAELLMPRRWVRQLAGRLENPCEVLEWLIEMAEVSMDAALIRVRNILDPGYVYASIDSEGLVVSSGRSDGTFVTAPERGLYLDRNAAFPMSDARWEARLRDRVWVWWRFASELKIPTSSDERDWREILDGILSDLHLDPTAVISMKQTISGIVGYVHGSVRRDPHRNSPEAVFAASMQRFNSRSINDPILRECVGHRDFVTHLAQRIRALGNSRGGDAT